MKRNLTTAGGRRRGCAKPSPFTDERYLACVGDLLGHPAVLSMKSYIQHQDIDCLAHCLYVSYLSYILCRRLGLDERAAARGGLLHDFFLYDWHQPKPYKGLHGFRHPKIALDNASAHFLMSPKERDIVEKHMWPLTITPPRHMETFVVAMVDKYCTVREVLGFGICGQSSPQE